MLNSKVKLNMYFFFREIVLPFFVPVFLVLFLVVFLIGCFFLLNWILNPKGSRMSENFLTWELVKLPRREGLAKRGKNLYWVFSTGKHTPVEMVECREYTSTSQCLFLSVTFTPRRLENRNSQIGFSKTWSDKIDRITLFGVSIY